MNEQKDHLPDGQYDCSATLHIKDGKAVVVLNSTFGLRPNTAIPLLRREGDLVVEQLTVSRVPLFNGITII